LRCIRLDFARRERIIDWREIFKEIRGKNVLFFVAGFCTPKKSAKSVILCCLRDFANRKSAAIHVLPIQYSS